MPSMDLECTDYHQKYKNLKRKLKALIYENECFQDELKKAQKKLLKVSRDKSFLLDRLLAYETVESSSSDSEATLLSDSDMELKAEAYNCKKKKLPSVVENQEGSIASSSNTNSTESKKKKSRKVCPVKVSGQQNLNHVILEPVLINHRDGHLTSEEIERHLEAKQPFQDLMPEKAPLTVPAEMFSDESSGIEKLVLVSQI